MLRNCFLFVLLTLPLQAAFPQNIRKMEVWQDSLAQLGKKMYHSRAEVERMESNFTFIKTLVSSLKEPNSYYFAFDKVDMISILNPADDSFRIFTWNIQLQDGSSLYYGAIQFKSSQLKLVPLLDKTFEIADPDNDIVTNKLWYGARYYDIVPIKKGQYILLGWKGHHAEYSKRVIEILNVISEDQISFGANVFSDLPYISRKIFNYNKSGSMLLRFNKDKQLLEFDNIVPLQGNDMKDYKNLGPDMSYNGYKVDKGKLQYVENIKVLNPADNRSNLEEASKKLKSGFDIK